MSQTPTPAAISSVLAGALCLSASAIIVKLADVDAATTAVLRCAIAVVPLIPLALAERQRQESLSPSGWLWSLAAGIALGIDYSAWTASIFLVGAGVATVLINVQVIVLPLLALIIDRERMERRFLIALPIMIIGIVLVSGVGLSELGIGPSASAAGQGSLGGVLLGLLAGIGYGTYLFLSRRATRTQSDLALQPLTWATAAAAATSTLITLFSRGLSVLDISGRSWILLIALALVGQVAAWLLIHHGSGRLPAEVTASLLLVQPVLALALSTMVLGERFGLGQIIGAAVVVGGVAVSSGLVRRPGARPEGS